MNIALVLRQVFPATCGEAEVAVFKYISGISS